jgi:hypothetical protein
MAVAVTVEGEVLAKYKKLPDRLRSQLRGDLPDIVRDVRDAVAAKLAPGALFKTTTHLLPALSSQMVENASEIYGRVYIDPSKFPAVVAHTLESGSVAHEIAAVNAPALVFFWERLGRVVAFRRVWHPGFAGRSYMASTLAEQADMIKQRLNKSVLEALNE